MKQTHSVNIFLAAHQAVAAATHMKPRSKNDKEYFPQDWFADRVKSLNLPYEPQGRNSYPDFWVGNAATAPAEGYEIKSLSFSKGKPARKDYDCNSSIPSGTKDGKDVFLVFFLYTGSGADPRPVQSLCIAHGNLINADHEVAAAHVNEAIKGFGSYGEGFIRNRKMYVFAHPLTIDPSGLGRCRLIVPSEWKVSHGDLRKVGTLNRTVASTSLVSYSIHLDGVTKASKNMNPRGDAGVVRAFDVFEHR